MQTFMDNLFSEIKVRGHISELKALPSVDLRVRRLDEILCQVNISKEHLSFYASNEQIHLFYRFQENGVDMGLCPHFYSFFSGRNQAFHHVCRTANKERACCNGKEIKCHRFTLKENRS